MGRKSGSGRWPSTIMARRRQPLLVTFTNQLPPGAEDSKYVNPNPQDPRTHPFIPASTVVHLHGFNADHASDGGGASP